MRVLPSAAVTIAVAVATWIACAIVVRAIAWSVSGAVLLNVAAFGVCSTLPAPQINCRVTRNGNSTSEIRENSPARTMR